MLRYLKIVRILSLNKIVNLQMVCALDACGWGSLAVILTFNQISVGVFILTKAYPNKQAQVEQHIELFATRSINARRKPLNVR